MGLQPKPLSDLKSITADILDGELVIRCKLSAPRLSASGKSMLVATTGGLRETELKVKGKPLIIGLNAYYAA